MKRNNGNGNGRIGGVVEFSVQSKDDLKALMHVRKLLSSNGTDGTSNLDQPTRSAYFGFLDGEAIVVSCAIRLKGLIFTYVFPSLAKTCFYRWWFSSNDLGFTLGW